jgi:hypothetical protein
VRHLKNSVQSRARLLAIALLLRAATARAEAEGETAAEAPAYTPPERTEAAEKTKKDERAQAAAERKAARSHGADCQLCYDGASGLELAIPLWLPLVGLKGETGEGDESQQVTFKPHLEFAIVAEFRLRFGPVGVGLTATGASLGTQVIEKGTGEPLGTVALAAYFGRATLDWYIPPIRFADGHRTELLAIWPYAGARYALLSGDGSQSNGTLLFDGQTSWGEPLVGCDVLLDLRRGWLFKLGGDLGGFGLGTEISMTGTVEARYAVTDWLNFRMGWRLYYARFPLGDNVATMLLQGPGAGFGIPLF